MHLDQRCSSAISPGLKKSGSFPLTHSSTAAKTSSSDRKWHPRISFFKVGNRKKSLGDRSSEYAGCGINSYPFHSTASIATLQVLSSCFHVAAKYLARVYLGVFYGWRFSAGLASLHSTLQLLYFPWVKSPTQ